MGIDLGDVNEEGDTIYGDGGNIGARLESMADASEICISESAYQPIKNELSLRILTPWVREEWVRIQSQIPNNKSIPNTKSQNPKRFDFGNRNGGFGV